MTKSKEQLLQGIEDLAPWHHRIGLRDGMTTGSGAQQDSGGNTVHQIAPEENFDKYIAPFLPDGMAGKSFLDCACNAGGYSFAAKDAGAARTFGFDVRQHWIDQANFVAAHRDKPNDGLRFEVADLMSLRDLDEEFDVTWFSGLLYHLPDPIEGLAIAANRTRELLFVNTATAALDEDEKEVPGLVLKHEATENLMSGVYGLSWLPTGPRTMRHMFRWLGFPETRMLFWKRRPNGVTKTTNGRMMIVAAREKGRLDVAPHEAILNMRRGRPQASDDMPKPKPVPHPS